MKKILSVFILIVMFAFVVFGTMQSARNVVEGNEATQVDFKDLPHPDMVPPAGPVNP